jgi:hypothetical protein
MANLQSLTDLRSIPIDQLVHAVDRQMHGSVSEAHIEEVLRELLARDFSDARVVTFVPIFLQRATCDALRREQAAARRFVS